MRALIQRVTSASVVIDGETAGSIQQGLLVLLGVAQNDTREECEWLAKKTAELRLFTQDGKMQQSVEDVGGRLLVISQFTLYGNVRKGTRPSFTKAAPPNVAEELYNYYIECLRTRGIHVETGRFGANMQVSLTNDGPVTLMLERDAKQ